MSGNIFDIEGKSPALTTNKGEGQKVGRIVGISMTDRGARPYTEGGGSVNEFSTVCFDTAKANAVTTEHSPKVITGLVLAGHAEGVKHEQASRVYDVAGKAPTLCAGTGGGTTKSQRSPWTKSTTGNLPLRNVSACRL